ncbi:dipeptidase [Anaerotignum propionicum]|uniref:Membrane dipeptidase n=1 Tax=Anaerotignum propionicum DSM 1682 TaxID=991789 RepID=A0A0X8VBT8_ANAPI|nr:dipeptidase [Anaerotignum propionicum]AMJ42043.1 membrane dipeptidase (peptidase family M19) [Anaerotignum propionicum DSM 1682]SHE50186.1 membrane dipeptidase [[Clostridium] propionicum DSM 1682] [Anaerotignum propionicum DSM 1682]
MVGYADGHCDTIVRLWEKNQELFSNDGHIDIVRLNKFSAPLQFFAIWLDSKYHPISMRQAMKYIEFYYSQLQKNSRVIGHINSFTDVIKNRLENKISALLALEGGEALEGEISAIHTYYRLGVRSITLTWNHRNRLADGVAEEESRGGLTRFGRQVIEEMEELGMLVDVSHLSESGFSDVVKFAKKPFIASHSNARAICDMPRNLKDNQLLKIAEKGGVVGLNLYSPFIVKYGQGGIDDILSHIQHMLSVMGEDFIALGTDFDGIHSTPKEISGVQDMDLLFISIENEFGKVVAEKIFSENLLRVLKEVL